MITVWPAAVAAATGGFMSSNAGLIILSLVAAMLIGLAVLSLGGQRGDVGTRIGIFVAPPGQPRQEPSLVERALGDRQDNQLERSPFAIRLAEEMNVAGMGMTVSTLGLVTVLGTIVLGYLMASQLATPLASPLALLAPFGVYMGIRFAADRQRRAFDEQLPDNLQVVASAMRAGQTFVGALATAIEDAPEPSRREIRRAVTDERLGVPMDEALERVTARMRSDEFHHVAVVATLQRETGGNTAEVIDLVTETIRERLDIRRMVRSLTAQGRLAGLMLSLLPAGLLLAISALDPHYVRPLFHTTLGLIGLAVAAVMVGLGGLAIRKIVTIKV